MTQRPIPLAVAVIPLFGFPALRAGAATAPPSIPNQLKSAVNVDKINHTATLPLYKGKFNV